MAQQKQFFRIEGDAVHLVSERVERTVRLTDLMDEVGRTRGVTTPILPLGCRFFSQQGERSVFVIEQAPTVRRAVWRNMEEGEQWKLAFPYVVFVVVFSGGAVSTSECRIFYRTRPLGSMEDAVLQTNLCNTGQDGGICTGNARVSGDTLAQKAESFVSVFWKSEFNSDLSGNCWEPAAARFPQVRSLTTWQAETEKNPLFPLGISWFEHGRLADAVEGRG